MAYCQGGALLDTHNKFEIQQIFHTPWLDKWSRQEILYFHDEYR